MQDTGPQGVSLRFDQRKSSSGYGRVIRRMPQRQSWDLEDRLTLCISAVQQYSSPVQLRLVSPLDLVSAPQGQYFYLLLGRARIRFVDK
jgi:hypothetical protein